MKAKEEYEHQWRGKLDALLEPAQNHLRQLLEDPNPAVRQRAIDQIFKYSGNDIQKHHVVTQDISIAFGQE
jgi:vesicle coat complex subunit